MTIIENVKNFITYLLKTIETVILYFFVILALIIYWTIVIGWIPATATAIVFVIIENL